MDEDYRRRYVNYICYFDNQSKNDLYTDSFKRKVKSVDSNDLVAEKFDEAKTLDKLDQTLYADFTTYLPDDLMVKVDMASMLVALECRSPFLDQELLELSAKIPFGLKLKGMNNKKYILKGALRNLVPDEVLDRTRKMGFGVPLEYWFKKDLASYISSILLSKNAINRGLFKKDYVRQMLKNHKDTQVNYSSRIWALLTLELWFREYFD
jgi:asparagine synthase (glutamine-hydrolysing)